MNVTLKFAANETGFGGGIPHWGEPQLTQRPRSSDCRPISSRRYVHYLSLCLGPVIAICMMLAGSAHGAEKEVTFKTEDGFTIHGLLDVPDGHKEKMPAAVLVPSDEHDRSAFGIYRFPGKYQYPGLAAVFDGKGVISLSLDLRGHGHSVRSGVSTPPGVEDLSKTYLDVRAAIGFLVGLPEVDSSRLALVAEGTGADAAVLAWGGDTRIRAIALISGRLGEPAKKMIAGDPTLPLMLLGSSEDRKGFTDMTDAYFLSKSAASDIEVYSGLGVGTGMFSVWRYKYPNERPMHESIGGWVAGQLLSEGILSEVSFQTQDGWTIYGNFRQPQGQAAKLPAVILLHSGLSDRYVYHDLEVALAKAGLAVLNIDWRGNGKSIGKGRYFELSKEERDKGYLDAEAAVDFLSAQPAIDPDRIGIVGTVIGAKHAMAAAAGDPRIKTVVVLTGYVPTAKEKAYLTSQKPPILYITSKGHHAVTQAMTELYDLTKDKGSELIVYDGGAIGYQLMELDDRLLPRIVRWMKDKLGQSESHPSSGTPK